MIAPLSRSVRSRFVRHDGIRSHYLEAGEGPPVVLLHDGSFGGSAALCWARNIDALARSYRVIAPDWLGFGDTDKLHDFSGGRARRLWHMTRFLETLDIDGAVFVGCSMGGTLLLQVAASREQPWPIDGIVVASGGGFVPLNDARRKLMEFDCTREGMRNVLSAIVHDPRWLDEDWLVSGRYEAAVRPGAWEAVAAARFKSPITQSQIEFGHEDRTPYERIDVPTLIFAGANDKLREANYANELVERIPNAELHVFDQCGHFPQIEHHEAFNALVLDFLMRRFELDEQDTRACSYDQASPRWPASQRAT